MTFTSPAALWLLAVPIALIGFYLWMRRRRRRHAVTYANLALVREVAAAQRSYRRHIPFALTVVALVCIVVAAARPHTSRTVELNRTTIVLALDTSSSMCAVDIEPNRIAAAQAAVSEFIAATPEGTRVGIVVFSSSARLTVAPTTDRERLTGAVDALRTSRGTAIGSAILESVDAIAEINAGIVPTGVPVETPPAAGEYAPDIVVVMTDGANSAGVDPLIAADEAAARGVRVYTIGFGTDEPIGLSCTADQLGPDGFGGFIELNEANDFLGFRQFLLIDQPNLETIASTTGGEFFRATDGEELTDVFAGLPAQVEPQTEEIERTVWFVLPAAIAMALALALSLAWNRYP
ncbi:MAG: VWA domain-containing protein [Actinomycetota bacterium]